MEERGTQALTFDKLLGDVLSGTGIITESIQSASEGTVMGEDWVDGRSNVRLSRMQKQEKLEWESAGAGVS